MAQYLSIHPQNPQSRLLSLAVEIIREGGLVAYPSTMLHEVAEVTRGQRLVAVTFIESQIIDERQRHMIYCLGEVSALEGLTMQPENRMRLELVRHNLIRMWS